MQAATGGLAFIASHSILAFAVFPGEEGLSLLVDAVIKVCEMDDKNNAKTALPVGSDHAICNAKGERRRRLELDSSDPLVQSSLHEFCARKLNEFAPFFLRHHRDPAHASSIVRRLLQSLGHSR